MINYAELTSETEVRYIVITKICIRIQYLKIISITYCIIMILIKILIN